MPVLTLECPDCGHVFQGGVFVGTKPPEIWICSRCRGKRSAEVPAGAQRAHPWETAHAGCGCCG